MNETSTVSDLLQRYGAPADPSRRMVYRAVPRPTSQPRDETGGEADVSDSNAPDQSLTPPVEGPKTIDLEAKMVGTGTLTASLEVVKRPRPTIKRTDHIAQYRIAGEMFYVEVEGEETYLRHPRWSLMGAGKSLADAEVALLEEAGLVARVFGAMSPGELDEEAERMLNFARRIA